MKEFLSEEVKEISGYLRDLVAGISPLATLDSDERIRFVNRSFLEEFGLQEEECLGKDFRAVVGLGSADGTNLKDNIERSSRERRVDNCNFQAAGRHFGYSIFRFEKDVGVILKDITDIKKLERRVTKLYSRLLEYQEGERQRLAGELHDGVGQTILAAKLNFTSYRNDPEKMESCFERGLELIDLASQELREIYTNLYPSALRELGLGAALRAFGRDFLALQGVDANIVIEDPAEREEELPQQLKTTIFRITQEAFANIVKHSGASSASLLLDLRVGNAAELIIKDNGRGFDTGSVIQGTRGHGLDNIRRRTEDSNGTLELTSSPGQETRLRVLLPCPESNEEESS